MKILKPFKPGDTFRLRLRRLDSARAAVDLTGYTVRMQLRSSPGGTLIASSYGAELLTLTFTLEDQSIAATKGRGYFTATAANTAGWAKGRVLADVEYVNPSGEVESTETFEIPFVEGPTR